jgi:hypothetical protein
MTGMDGVPRAPGAGAKDCMRNQVASSVLLGRVPTWRGEASGLGEMGVVLEAKDTALEAAVWVKLVLVVVVVVVAPVWLTGLLPPPSSASCSRSPVATADTSVLTRGGSLSLGGDASLSLSLSAGGSAGGSGGWSLWERSRSSAVSGFSAFSATSAGSVGGGTGPGPGVGPSLSDSPLASPSLSEVDDGA